MSARHDDTPTVADRPDITHVRRATPYAVLDQTSVRPEENLMAIKRQVVPVRTGTTADWASGPLLKLGEIGVDTDKGLWKMGDGSTAFGSLPSLGGGRTRTGTVTLVAGAATVSLAGVTASSVVVATTKTLGTVSEPSALRATPSTTGGGQIVFDASQATDTSVIQYVVIDA